MSDLDKERLMEKLIEVDDDPFLQQSVYPRMIHSFTTGLAAGKTDPKKITAILLTGIVEIFIADGGVGRVAWFREKLFDFALVFTGDEELAQEAMAALSPSLNKFSARKCQFMRIDEGIGLD